MAARASIMVAVLMFFFMLHGETDAARYYVGGKEFGWTNDISMEAWPQGKTFFVGDILEFHYDTSLYDVAVVNQAGHDTCTVNNGAKVFDSGNDAIPLQLGANYFICTNVDDCSGGMKMAIDAKPRPST